MVEISTKRLDLMESEKETRFNLLEKKCEWLQLLMEKKITSLEFELLMLKYNGDALNASDLGPKLDN